MREIVTGTSAMVVWTSRKYFSVPKSAGETCCSTARASGPCSASAPRRSEMSSIATSIPTAFIESQRMFGSALVSLKVPSSSRLIVPSSITLPCASHQGV